MRVKEGEADEYAYIVERFQQRMFTYCRLILNNDEDAEDAVQDIFVKAYRSINQFQANISFSAWLYRIAHNHCLNLIRKQRSYLRMLGLWKQKERTEEQVMLPASSPTDLSFELAWGALSPEERCLLILHAVEEKSVAEIAEILSVKPETVKKRLYRTKKKLKKQSENVKEESSCQELSKSTIKI